MAHVEAGLRSYNRDMPEEMNRVLTDHMSSILFCPSATAVDNLGKEGIFSGVHNVGDIMYDSLLLNLDRADGSDILTGIDGDYIVASVHRNYNADSRERLSVIVDAFTETEATIVFPVHPRTLRSLHEFGLHQQLASSGNVTLLKPVGYVDFLRLMRDSKKIITDSGGVQKEAYFLQKPCITLRPETEWVETVSDGWNVLVDCDKDAILDAIANHSPTGKNRQLYGNGDAARKIVKIIEEHFP